MGDDGCIHTSTLQAMSEEQLKSFLEAVKSDAGLQEKLKAAADADAVVAIAKGAGFAISAEELQHAQAEVSEEEVESVAGGLGQSFVYGQTAPPCFCL
jgi:predicted ribosomally synthesized peptide with nif11-like leader